MSHGTHPFNEKFGVPAPVSPNGLVFPEEWANELWQEIVGDTGSGTFLNGFIQLFGAELREFDTIPHLWSFLLKDQKERWVIGKNAYGCLLVLESPSIDGTMGMVGLLDPLNVNYFTNPNLELLGLVGHWLPQEKLTPFQDATIYEQFGHRLSMEEILAVKTPISLGGKMVIDNFQVENIFDYYRTTGELYAKYPGH